MEEPLISASISVFAFALGIYIGRTTSDNNSNEPYTIPKHERHDHYFIEDQLLLESYLTIRGLRSRELKEVPGMQDTDECDEDCLERIRHGERTN